MRTTQGNTLQSLRTTRTFLDTNDAVLGDINKTGVRKQLNDVMVDLSDHESEQAGKALDAQVETRKQRTLRQDLLRTQMIPIARVAKLALPRTEELLPLRMPRGQLSVTRLASAAKGMATAALPYTGVFVSAGLPADFITRLTNAADAMLASINQRTQSQSLSTGASRAIEERLSTARKVVNVLDALVTVTLANDPKLLAAWAGVTRVAGARRTPSPASAPTATTIPPTGIVSPAPTVAAA